LHPDGRLTAFYSKHGDQEGIRTRTTIYPGNIRRWTPERLLKLNDKTPKSGYCYSHPALLAEENYRLYLTWRGIDWKPNIAWSDNMGKTWSKGQILVSAIQGHKKNRPYFLTDNNGDDTIYFTFTDGHPRNEPNNSVYYMNYRKGAFHKADGSTIKKLADLEKGPIAQSQCDKVYDGHSGQGRAWIFDIAHDKKGYPVIAFTVCPKETEHYYHYARWDGQRWHQHRICAAGKWFPKTPANQHEREPHYSAGIAIDRNDPSIVYLARPVKDIFEIERWTTKDQGKTWTSTPITKDSKLDNVRPVAIRNPFPGGPSLFWMQNRRYLHYTDYDSSVHIH